MNQSAILLFSSVLFFGSHCKAMEIDAVESKAKVQKSIPITIFCNNDETISISNEQAKLLPTLKEMLEDIDTSHDQSREIAVPFSKKCIQLLMDNVATPENKSLVEKLQTISADDWEANNDEITQALDYFALENQVGDSTSVNSFISKIKKIAYENVEIPSKSLCKHLQPVSAITANDSWIVTASHSLPDHASHVNDYIYIYDAKTLQLHDQIRMADGGITALAIANNILAVVCNNNAKINVYSIATKTVLASFDNLSGNGKNYQNNVTCLRIANNCIYARFLNNSIKIFDLATLTLVKEFSIGAFMDIEDTLEVTKDNVALSNLGYIFIHNNDLSKKFHLFHPKKIAKITIAGNKLISLCDDYIIRTWDLTTRQLLHQTEPNFPFDIYGKQHKYVLNETYFMVPHNEAQSNVIFYKYIYAVLICKDNRTIARKLVTNHGDEVSCLMLNGENLITGSYDGSVSVWDLTTFNKIQDCIYNLPLKYFILLNIVADAQSKNKLLNGQEFDVLIKSFNNYLEEALDGQSATAITNELKKYIKADSSESSECSVM